MQEYDLAPDLLFSKVTQQLGQGLQVLCPGSSVDADRHQARTIFTRSHLVDRRFEQCRREIVNAIVTKVLENV